MSYSCPQNTKCNMKQQTCESTESNYTSSWLKKVPAKSKLDEDTKLSAHDPVLCADGKTQCKQQIYIYSKFFDIYLSVDLNNYKKGDPLKVCCKLTDSTYGCCPYVDGVCCDAYCCPSNLIFKLNYS